VSDLRTLDLPTIATLARQDGNAIAVELVARIEDALRWIAIAREERDALVVRRDELLALVARISQSTPLPDELVGWEGQRVALVAEVGTQRARVAAVRRERDALAAAVLAFRDARAAFADVGADAIDRAREAMFALASQCADAPIAEQLAKIGAEPEPPAGWERAVPAAAAGEDPP
jgi:hypothetical protein